MVKPNIGDIKKIREMTGISFDLVRKAIEEADGNIEKSLKILKKGGLETSAKKSARETEDGLIFSYVHSNGKIGVLLKLLCETDFVARNEEFKKLGHEIAMHIAATNPQNIEELLAENYVRDQDLTIDLFIKSYITKTGENIRISEFSRFYV